MLSLFSGIGGIDLAAQWAGIETVAFVEIEPFCQKVLARHWPGVPIFDDVRNVTAESLRERGIHSVDIIAGGFPCQDVSFAGSGAGIDGRRSGLWSEMFRLVSDIRPRYVVVENVAALLERGLGRVLGDLAARGFDAEWDCIPAASVGAPHRRDRLFLVAYPQRNGRHSDDIFTLAFNVGRAAAQSHDARPSQAVNPSRGGSRLPDWSHTAHSGRDDARNHSQASGGLYVADYWRTEPALDRVADGIPNQLQRLKALGNSVVPQVVYPIFEAIARTEAAA